jgi:conjugative transfer pilus assembly protein TraH
MLVTMQVNNANAGINSALGNIWKSLGGESVSSGASHYKGQKGGHYTFGSTYFARPVKNRPIISINPPEIDFDKNCYSQGVLNFGGISFISGSELKEKLQGIMQQAGMMFVYLGITAISPIISETLQEVYSKLQELGGFLSNECQAAKQIVGFAGDMLSRHSSAAQGIMSKLKLGGENTDLSKIYKTYPAGKKEALKEAAEKDERLIIEDVNIAWKALEKLKARSANDKSDKEIKEFMMTLSGTVIIKSKGDNPPQPQYISSRVTSPDILRALLKGGSNMKSLQCDDAAKCLNVTDVDKLIEKENSFEQKIKDHFNKFKEALIKDEELKPENQKFLEISGLPVYKLYDVLYQYTKAHPEYEEGIIVEVVAWNILYNYLADILKEVSEATNNLQLSASDELKDFKRSIINTQKLLADFEMKDLQRYQTQLFLVNRSESFEKMMADQTAQIFNLN